MNGNNYRQFNKATKDKPKQGNKEIQKKNHHKQEKSTRSLLLTNNNGLNKF